MFNTKAPRPIVFDSLQEETTVRLPGSSYVTSPYWMIGRTTCTITSMMK